MESKNMKGDIQMSEKSTKSVATASRPVGAATQNEVTKPVAAVSKPSIDFSNIAHITAKDLLGTGSRGGRGVNSLSIVHSSKGQGTRVKLSDTLYQSLNSPSALQFVPNGTDLVVGEKLPGATETFKFPEPKPKSKRTENEEETKINAIIYNAGLVKWLIATFKLDYSDCVSRAFNDVRFETQTVNGEEFTYAIVNMAG
jgi:hypothetical protein